MKAIHLNLAAKPYRDYRAVYAIAFVLAAVTAILMVYNAQTAYRYFVNTRATRQEIDDTEAKIAQERQKADALRDRLAQVDTRALDAEAHYINLQIADRAFSWTRLLDRLERVVPPTVRLNGLNPSVGEDGKTHIEMTCTSKTPDGMVVLLDRLIADPQFANPVPHSESQANGEYNFSLGVDYEPAQKAVAQKAKLPGVRR